MTQRARIVRSLALDDSTPRLFLDFSLTKTSQFAQILIPICILFARVNRDPFRSDEKRERESVSRARFRYI